MLTELQQAVLRALLSPTPVETLREAAGSLPAAARALVDRIDPDGFALTALLIRKLRFERVCTGDPAWARWFEREPGGCTEIFRAYCRDVAPRSFFPDEEAQVFRAWCQERGYRPGELD